MGKVTINERVQLIQERIAYLLIYAPNLPIDDETTVDREFDGVIADLASLRNQIQDLERRHWLDLAFQEIEDARTAFGTGDSVKGRRSLESVEDRLKSWHKREKARPSFIVGPDGETEKV
jgi:hypothetical protein